ncbi:relaxase/mobilization nuclease-like protein [Mucilaginibacter yixingensis]|uniref:Relaxase/mobilization nuclease-like protein n=1 Tax=Mucilaginibacter yixingensis TaxID=1295612 RepID=A0A2T5J4J8_9SPHI|nr:relaxase/mobilization nuclease domain-containing protein [Mucilaginibacter yixingensis]PTQ92433.1 relaxase/mobilization nuclease-like protein [Mucilaginibacter yixingensis]
MIASQRIGKSFLGALNYNVKKLHKAAHERAELLGTNFSSVAVKNILREVDLMRQLRPQLGRYVYHTSLNFSAADISNLTNEKLLDIALDYLTGMGFTNNQYLIFRHYDAGHPHIHLLANRICFDGSVVSDSNNYNRSEKLVRALEYRYNLTPVGQSNYVVKERNNHVNKYRSNTVTGEPGTSITNELDNYVTRNQPNNITAERNNPVNMYRSNTETDKPRNPITNKRGSGVTSNQPNNITTERNNQQNKYLGTPENEGRSNPIIGHQSNPMMENSYNQVTIERNNYRSLRAPKKGEIEMSIRMGKPSDKMLLQEKLALILKSQSLSMQDFIQQCEMKGVLLLFNQASTGRVSGITYFHEGFKAKGQALGERFKWMEIVKQLDYEQNRDSEAISETNRRTRQRYGLLDQAGAITIPGRSGERNAEPVSGKRKDVTGPEFDQEHGPTAGITADQLTAKAADALDSNVITVADSNNYDGSYDQHLHISIAEDIDDEAINGRNRRRQQRARTNTR